MQVNKMKTTRGWMMVVLVAGATLGCTTAKYPDLTGNSVRSMVKAQIYDPQAAANPDPLGPQGQDGMRAITDLENLERNNDPGRDVRARLKSQGLEHKF